MKCKYCKREIIKILILKKGCIWCSAKYHQNKLKLSPKP